MSYRTVSIKLARPTAVKRQAIDQAMVRYTRAFQALLAVCRPQCQQMAGQGGTHSAALCGREQLALADIFEAQPFKDALQRDVQGLLRSYLGRRKAGYPASYPLCRAEDGDLSRILSRWNNFSCSEIYTNLDKYDTLRPVSFCRYGAGRDYSVLRSEKGERYYGKVYLFNRQQALPAQPAEDILRDIVTGQVLRDRHKRRRYLLLPLEPGDWQRRLLRDAEQGLALPKGGWLRKQGKDYFLCMRLFYQDPVPCPPACFLGVARWEKGLCLCAWDGVSEQRQYRQLSVPPGPKSQGQLCSLANQVAAWADQLSAQMVLENLGRRTDGLEDPALSAGEYRRLAELLGQRAQRAGLPEPVRVSPNRLERRCPVCGQAHRGSGLQGQLFLCAACGYSQPAGQARAAALAGALERYGRSRLRVQVVRKGSRVRFRCPALEREWETEDSPQAAQWFCQQVERLLSQPPDSLTRRQRSVARKFAQWPRPPEGWFQFV